MRTEPKTARGRRTVQRILDAACELFAQQGIRSTTLDQVLDLSGTGRGQLYLYFAGKTDLVTAVVSQQVDRVLDPQQPFLSAMSTADEMRGWCEFAVHQYAGDQPVRCPIGSLIHELGPNDADARAALASGFARWQSALAEGLQRIHDRGELAPGVQPEAAAATFLAAYQGGVLMAAAMSDLQPLRTALETTADTVLG